MANLLTKAAGGSQQKPMAWNKGWKTCRPEPTKLYKKGGVIQTLLAQAQDQVQLLPVPGAGPGDLLPGEMSQHPLRCRAGVTARANPWAE
ncbi:Hypothetical predicted protein, partial [Marmota monax]